jgi:branched-chain amino acid transport system permease protein
MLAASGVSGFLQLSVSGIALGALYGLVALGFVIVLASSGVLNLMHGGFVLLGAYLVYNAHNTWGLPFPIAVLVAAAMCAAVGVLLEGLVVRRLGSHAHLAGLLVTLGLLYVTEPLVTAIWGYDQLNLGDPWALNTIALGDVRLTERDIAVISITAAVFAGFFALFRFSELGVAMRAAASDREAAFAQGISPRVVMGVAWGVAGVVGTLAGLLLATAAGGGVRPELAQVGLAALPAIILGGLDSPIGAVVGGLVMGLAQQYAAGYAPDWLGQGFSEVMPYLVMTLLLLLRPHGLFGTKAVRRA